MKADDSFPANPAARSAAVVTCIFATLAPLAPTVAPHATSTSHDFSRILQIAVMLVCTFCVGRLVCTTLPRLTGQATLVLGGMLVIASTTAAFAASKPHALRELAIFTGLICIAVCFAALRRGFVLKVVLPLLGIGSAVYALALVLVMIASAASGQVTQFLPEELFLGYDNYRFYNHVQTVALPLLALAAIGPGARKAMQWLSFTGLCCAFGLLWLSGGRATMLALGVAVLGAAVFAGPSGQRFAKRMAYAAVIGGLLGFVLTHAFEDSVALRSVSDTTSGHARLFLWGIAWGHIQASPWLGIGPMHYASVVNVEAAHPHNVYLQLAAEWGLPLCLLVVLVAARAFFKLSVTVRSAPDDTNGLLGAGLWAACLAIAIDGLFSGNFVMPLSQCWIAAALGLAVGWYRQTTGQDESAPVARMGSIAHHRSIGWLGGLAVLSQLWLIQDIWPEARHLEAHLEQVRQLDAAERTNPRFWSHGWFKP